MTLHARIRGALTRAYLKSPHDHDGAASEVMALIHGYANPAQPREFDVIEPSTDENDPERLAFCEWPVRSGFRTSDTCGRTGARATRYGIRTCWQHEDALLSEVAQRVREGMAHDLFMTAVVDALTNADNESLTRAYRSSGRWGDAIEQEVIRRLNGEHWALGPEVDDALDALIERRIAEKWSKTA